MKTWLFSNIVIFLFSFGSSAWARLTPEHETCAQSLEDIQSEFQHRPDDGRNGLITAQVPLTTTAMLTAYSKGIFPWFSIPKLQTAAWFSPPERGILHLDNVHFTSREQRFFRNADKKYHWTIDKAFEQVIKRCAELRAGDTWISKEYLSEYPKLARMGHAHSIEIWRNDNGKLAGGLYGVDVNGTFTGESIYHEPDERNVDKYALYILFELLKASERTWLDTQVRTPLIKQVGGELVSRDVFQKMRAKAEAENKPFPPLIH